MLFAKMVAVYFENHINVQISYVGKMQFVLLKLTVHIVAFVLMPD